MRSEVRLRRSWIDSARFWLAAVGGLLVGAVGLGRGVGWDWPQAASAGVAIGALAGVLSELASIRDQQTHSAEVRRRLLAVLYRGTPAPIQSVDPYGVGVFRSATADSYASGGHRAPYFARSIDNELRMAIGRLAVQNGGLVVVSGDPKSGKSRTLWEALADQVGSRIVYALHTPFGTTAPTNEPFRTLLEANVAIKGGQTVIWIDDAHEHFTRGLTYRAVEEFLRRHRGLILAMTVHRKRLEHRTSIDSTQVVEIDSDLLDWLRLESQPHQLDVELDSNELMGARTNYPGLTERIGPKDFKQLPSWFAGVNLLRDRYRDNRACNPRGVAIAKAVIDWRRMGMPAGITIEELRELAAIELDQLAPNQRFTDDSYDEAFNWATAEVAPGAALVRPIPGTDHGLWEDFDAVTSWSPSVDGPLGDRCWDFVAQHLTPSNALGVGVAAHQVGRLAFSERAFRAVAMSPGPGQGKVDAMYNLGVVLAERGDGDGLTEAERWWKRAANQGHTDAMLRLAASRPGEAERWWRLAVRRGHIDAMHNLGVVLAERGDADSVAEAEQWWRRAANEGNATAMYNLGLSLSKRGEFAEADQWYRRAANKGNTDAMTNLGVLLRSRNQTEAEQWWRRAANEGNATAMFNLAALLAVRPAYYYPEGRTHAEQWYRRAANKGHAGAMYNLAMQLAERGANTEAEHWYRKAAELAHPNAMARLGVLLRKHGNLAEAEEWYRKVADNGHTDSILKLVTSSPAEAEQWWRRAADRDHVDAMHNLAALLYSRGDDNSCAEAQRWWRRAADRGHVVAMRNLAALLYSRGDDNSRAEAQRWTMRADAARYGRAESGA